jgi:hypothetical protein
MLPSILIILLHKIIGLKQWTTPLFAVSDVTTTGCADNSLNQPDMLRRDVLSFGDTVVKSPRIQYDVSFDRRMSLKLPNSGDEYKM